MWRCTKSFLRHVRTAPVTRRRRRALPTDETLHVILPYGYFTTLPRTAISSQVARALTKRLFQVPSLKVKRTLTKPEESRRESLRKAAPRLFIQEDLNTRCLKSVFIGVNATHCTTLPARFKDRSGGCGTICLKFLFM